MIAAHSKLSSTSCIHYASTFTASYGHAAGRKHLRSLSVKGVEAGVEAAVAAGLPLAMGTIQSRSVMGPNSVIGSVAALLCAGLASMAWLPQPIIPWEKEYIYSFERNTTRLPVQDDISESDYTRVTFSVPSHGDILEAWLYEPVAQDPATPPPCLLMSHGLGSQKDMGLHAYAEQFAQAGIAVVAFDYRGFGGSDGAVRHWVSWTRQIEDIQSVLDYVKSGGLGQGRVDPNRIALWGVSYSGGHMLSTAAKKENWDKVVAVVANEPYLSGGGNVGKALGERGYLSVARLLLAAVLDKARELVGASPIYVKLIAPFGELAVLNVSPEELAASRAGQVGPPVRIGGWKNAIAARMLIDNFFYKPINHVQDVKCPVLFIAGTYDDLTPASAIHNAAALVGSKAQVLERPYGHIEMHRKMVAPEELAPIIDFLRNQLGLRPVHVPTKPHEAHPEQDAAEAF